MKHLVAIVAACAAVSMLSGQSEPAAEKAQWHFPIHLGYVSGISDVSDAVSEGAGASDTFAWPIAASFQPYLMFPNGFGFGFDVGPIALVALETDGDGEWDDADTSVFMPLGAYVRYDFARASKTSAYVRAGMRQCLTSGDLVQNGSLGANAGLGVEFSRDRRIRYGFEVSYDMCEVEVLQYWSGTYVEEKPFGFMISAFVSF
jgi:hypothetical protein